MSALPDCRESSRWLSRLLDADLPASERVRLQLHLVLCADCRHVEEQMRFLREAMRRMDQDDEPPAR